MLHETVMKTKLLFVFTFFLASSAFADGPTLSFAQSGDGVISAVFSTGPCPIGINPAQDSVPAVAFNANEIDISSSHGGISSPPAGGFLCHPQASPGYTVTALLGKLADGHYTVVWDYYPGQTTAKFDVVAGSLRSIFPSAISGAWYDPAFSGSGFNFQMSAMGLLVSYYGWDGAGNRLWLVSEIGPTSLVPDSPITLKMSHTTGGTFGNPQHNMSSWGTLVLNFANCRSAKAVLSGKDGILNLNLMQLAGLSGLPSC